ncbi:hypothetical protein [Streptomyces sp. NPDC127098]|uniref:hypothetical protein n=1 Tax=Streptomyces sp. NPDC127098 TaxID=3347137 RepID=UPI00366651FA
MAEVVRQWEAAVVFIALAAEALDEVRWIERSGIDEEDVQRSLQSVVTNQVIASRSIRVPPEVVNQTGIAAISPPIR